jgi:hypothetical protein
LVTEVSERRNATLTLPDADESALEALSKIRNRAQPDRGNMASGI